MNKRLISVVMSVCISVASVMSADVTMYAAENTTNTLESNSTTKSAVSDFVIENGVLTGYNGTGGNVVIPDTVTEILNDAFYGNDDIISVTIPDTVKKIERESFRFCENLESVSLPANLQSIEIGTFEACNRLKKINLPDTIKSIGAYAFDYCNELQNIVVPKSVTTIGEYAFSNIWNLESVVIPNTVTSIGTGAFSTENMKIVGAKGSEAEVYANKNSIGFVESGENAQIIMQTSGTGSLSVKKDGKEVTTGTTLKSGDCITITTSHNMAGQIVTANGADITSAVIKPNSWGNQIGYVESESALKERKYIVLGDTTISAQFLNLGTVNQVLNAEDSNISFNVSGEQTFKSNIFMGRTVMELSNHSKGTATITASVQGPGYVSFDYLSEVYDKDDFRFLIDNKVMDSYVHDNCWKTATYQLSSGKHTITWQYQGTDDTDRAYLDNVRVYTDNSLIPVNDMTINDDSVDLKINEAKKLDVTLLPKEAEGKKITWTSSDEKVAVVTNGTVTGVGKGKAVITAEIEGLKDKCTVYVTNYKMNGDFELQGNTITAYYGDASKVILPQEAGQIGNNAFKDHTEIREIDFGSTLNEIGAYAFYGCTGISEVVIPDNVTEIGRNAFAYCDSLENIVIGKGVTKIPHFAFFKDTNLKTVAIPATVTEIDNDAFSKSDNVVIYCEKDSAAYNYAIKRGLHYCLVDGEILGESFDSSPYEVIDKEEAIAQDFQNVLGTEILVDADTEYTYYLSGTKLYRQDIARNIFDATYIYDMKSVPSSIYVKDSVIYYATAQNSQTLITGYDIFKSKETFSMSFPINIYSAQFVVDGEQNFYFVKNSKDIYVYDKNAEELDKKILSNSAFASGMNEITLNYISKNNNVLFANFYSWGRELYYSEEYSFDSLSSSMNFSYSTKYYEGYRIVRNGNFIDDKYWIKNPDRANSAKWRFFDQEKYAVNQYGEIAEFDWNSKKEEKFDYEILFRIEKNNDYSVNASTSLGDNLYVYGNNGTVFEFNTTKKSVAGHYELGEKMQVQQIYSSNGVVYVRYEKEGTQYIAPLKSFEYQEKKIVTRSDHITMTYGKEQVRKAYLDSVPKNDYSTEQSHYKVVPKASASYQAGELSANVIADTLKRLNYARWQCGLNSVSLKNQYMIRSQKGAVLLKAVGELTHDPSQPDDMSDDFYKEGCAGVGADIDYSGNVSWGDDLVSSIFGYLNDVDNMYAGIGHRLSLLDKKADATSFGFCGWYSDLSMYYATEELNNNESYYAWPSAGYFPSEGIDINAQWHIVTDFNWGKNLKVTFQVGTKKYETTQVYYEADYSAFYFDLPKELKNELTGGKRKFGDGKAVQVSLTGLVDEKGNEIIVSYPVKFVVTSPDEENDDDKDKDAVVSKKKVTNVTVAAANRPYGAKTFYGKKNSKISLKAKVVGTGTLSKKVTWSSSNKKVATVNKTTGKVKIRASKGTAKITATSVDDTSKKVTITIKAVGKRKVNKVLKVKNKTVKLKKKSATAQIKIKKYTKKTTDKVTYKVKSGKKYVKVDKYGVITCKVKPGKKVKAAKIQVKCGKRKQVIKIKISK
ncbi:MAG: leucine-rich repeat protein [Eubacterium sp.]